MKEILESKDISNNPKYTESMYSTALRKKLSNKNISKNEISSLIRLTAKSYELKPFFDNIDNCDIDLDLLSERLGFLEAREKDKKQTIYN